MTTPPNGKQPGNFAGAGVWSERPDLSAFRVRVNNRFWGGGAHLRLVDAPAATRARLQNHRIQRCGVDLYRDDPNSTPPSGLIPHHS